VEIFIGYILKALVLPPGGSLFAILLSLGVPRRRRWLRGGLFVAGFVSLWLCCTPWFAGLLAAGLESYPALDRTATQGAGAIVVLGGGREIRAREYEGSDTLRDDTLVRVRYGAVLARALGLPVAVSGGTVLEGNTRAVGVIMDEVLEREFNVPVEWVEASSRNTAENAARLAEMLTTQRIILVTHAYHMRRAVAVFERVGFTVVPAPTAFIHGTGSGSLDIFSWLPSASALGASRAVLHEWLGLAYYALRYRRATG
tara:strand:+ start:45 stop:815 length:771 start_codon:yes stop_codon:yes gene_type:complete